MMTPQPPPPAWQQTLPFNRHPPLGHVDWVSTSGFPLRATLFGDGKWGCTSQKLAALFDAFRTPEESPEDYFGRSELHTLARAVGGKVYLVSIDLALMRRPEDGRLKGKDVVDG